MSIIKRVFITLFNLICFVLKYFWIFLTKESIPLWVSLFLFVGTGWGTYYLAPEINLKFEQQKMRSAYITSNLENFNSLSRSLISDISIFNNNLKKNGYADEDLRQNLQSKITELQWRALELDLIFSDQKSLKLIENYKNCLKELGLTISTARTAIDAKKVAFKVIPFADSSLNIIKALAEKAGLNS